MQQSSCPRPRSIVSCAREWDERRTDLDGASPAKQHPPCIPGTAVSSQSPEPVPRKSTQILSLGQKVLTSYCRPHSDRDLPPWTRVTFPSPKPFGRASPSTSKSAICIAFCDSPKKRLAKHLDIDKRRPRQRHCDRRDLLRLRVTSFKKLVVAGVGDWRRA
ncbi:hypothetical protein V8C43DRAFT_82699 [Trichoderma afarasin]